MRILNVHLSMSSPDKVGYQIHWSRTIQRYQCRDVLHGSDLEFTAQVTHATRFQLKYSDGIAFVEQIIGVLIVQRQEFYIEVYSFR